MDELSDDAQRLIAAAMADDDPPDVVADTGWTAMAERLSQGAERSAAPVTAAATPHTSSTPRWLMLPAALALAGAIAWVFTQAKRDEPDDAPARTREASATAPKRDAAAPHRPAQPERPSEASLIEHAEAALAGADPERALDLLDRHALQFPIGERADDRFVLRIQALCALDRATEAKAEVAGVRRVRPDAPELLRVADTCAAP